MKNRFIIVLLLSAVIILVTLDIGGAMGMDFKDKSNIKARLKEIDISKGVNKEEAIIIAQNYLIEKGLDNMYLIHTAKVMNDAYNKPDYWCIQISTTPKVALVQGLKWGCVFVNKQTSDVKYGGEGPS